MAKLVKAIHDLVSLAIDKGYTQYITDSQIDDVIDQGQMVLFRQLLSQHPKTKRIRNDLLPFEKKAAIVITGNVGPMPTDFEHEIEMWFTASSGTYRDIPVQIVEEGFFRRRVRDVVDPPSETNIFGAIYFDTTKKLEIYPASMTPIYIRYFKRPVKPVYATDTVNSQQVYNDGSSTDVEWSGLTHDILVQYCLAPLGLNMRDGQVQRAGQPEEPKIATV